MSPPRFEHLTRLPKLKCAVSPLHLIIKHLITLVVSLAQLVSPSVALLAELVLATFRICMKWLLHFVVNIFVQSYNKRGEWTVFLSNTWLATNSCCASLSPYLTNQTQTEHTLCYLYLWIQWIKLNTIFLTLLPYLLIDLTLKPQGGAIGYTSGTKCRINLNQAVNLSFSVV